MRWRCSASPRPGRMSAKDEAVRQLGIGSFEKDRKMGYAIHQERFQLTLGAARVEIQLDPSKPQRLKIGCSACDGACKHQGAAFAFIGEIFPGSDEDDGGEIEHLAGAFKAKLSDCMEKGDDGRLKRKKIVKLRPGCPLSVVILKIIVRTRGDEIKCQMYD